MGGKKKIKRKGLEYLKFHIIKIVHKIREIFLYAFFLKWLFLYFFMPRDYLELQFYLELIF